MPPKWIEKAKYTYNIHAVRSRDDPKWKLKDTAKFLGRSIGSVCEDLLLIKWWKNHQIELEKFENVYEALGYIRKKQKEDDFKEIE